MRDQPRGDGTSETVLVDTRAHQEPQYNKFRWQSMGQYSLSLQVIPIRSWYLPRETMQFLSGPSLASETTSLNLGGIYHGARPHGHSSGGIRQKFPGRKAVPVFSHLRA